MNKWLTTLSKLISTTVTSHDLFTTYNQPTKIKTTLKSSTAGIYLLKVNNRSTKTRCKICSRLTIKIPERRHWRRSGIFIVNFEHISHFVLACLCHCRLGHSFDNFKQGSNQILFFLSKWIWNWKSRKRRNSSYHFPSFLLVKMKLEILK